MDRFGTPKERQATLSAIEKMLHTKVLEAEKVYYIDRTQEDAVCNFVSFCHKEYEKFIKRANQRISKNEENFKYNYGMYSLATTANKKLMHNTVKDSEKETSDELRAFFDDIDKKTEKFYSSGISRQNLTEIIRIFNGIKEFFDYTPAIVKKYEVNRKPLPATFTKKIDKWTSRLDKTAIDVLKVIYD